ncbi:MAG: hypothetical protein ABI629_04480 [bacterium]
MHRRWALGVCVLFSVALLIIGATLVRGSDAEPATTWMHMFTPADFPTGSDLIAFLLSLRVPIPPVIAALEIISVQLTGSTDLVMIDLYRVGLAGTYLLALWLTFPSIPRQAAAFAASVIFLWATTLIHPFNAQIYDILLPFFLLLFFTLTRALLALPARWRAAQLACAVGAGFFLAMAELARPFVLLLLPVLLTSAYLGLRQCPRRVWIALLMPVVLLSGLWHAHLFVAYGQVLSTNYSGFNLYRAWPQAPLGPTVQETHSQPAHDARWPNINTQEQFESSQFLQRAVLAYIVSNPGAALRHAAHRLVRFAKARTSMYGGQAPTSKVLTLYAVAAPALFLFMFANVLVLAWYAVRLRARALSLLSAPDNALLLITFLSLLVLSLGEAKEEARLVLSLLPLLAAVPMARSAGGAPTDGHQSYGIGVAEGPPP